MEDNTDITGAVYELFNNAKRMYGDAVENYWFCESETCPACARKIDTLQFGKKAAISLNAFVYRDMNTLIAYFLCSRYATEIFRKSKQSKIIYPKLEENLKKAYTEFIKGSAS
jgi:hypothetical protein